MEAQQEVVPSVASKTIERLRPGGRRAAILSLQDRAPILRLVDMLLLNIGIGGALLIQGVRSSILMAWPGTLLLVGLADTGWLFAADIFDAYRMRTLLSTRRAAAQGMKAACCIAALIVIPAIMDPAWIVPGTLAGGFLLLAIPLLRSAVLGIFARIAEPLLFFGPEGQASALARLLDANPQGSLSLVGYFNGREPKGVASYGVHFLGDIRQFDPHLFGEGPVTLIVSDSYLNSSEFHEVAGRAIEAGIRMHPLSEFLGDFMGRYPLEVLEVHAGALPIQHPGNRLLFRLTKRAMDFCLALLGMMVLTPAFPFIALAIYLESPGPIFYKQKRVGKGGREFLAYKFRSMVPDAEKGKALWATDNDSRVTRVGRLLRKTHVDEFPQFINILKGEMSAVGPRPERPEFVEELEREIPYYHARHAVKPGMAGWALVNQGYAASKEDARIKHEYDLYYIKHQSLWFDLVILAKTVLDTVTLGGR